MGQIILEEQPDTRSHSISKSRETSTQSFYVLNLGGCNNVILGYPWLTRNNPQINWEKREVHMIGTPVPRHDEPEVVEQRYLI